VRIVAASNVDLLTLFAKAVPRRFVSRLNVIHLQIRRRDRREDVPLLLAHFLDRYARKTRSHSAIHASGDEASDDYDCRQREGARNVVERAVVLSTKSARCGSAPEAFAARDCSGVRLQLSEFCRRSREPGSRPLRTIRSPPCFRSWTIERRSS